MKGSIKLVQLLILSGVAASLSSLALADSTRIHSSAFKAQVQAPTTSTDSQRALKIRANAGGRLSCPVGYALTEVNTERETSYSVNVPTECNGIAGFGAAHVWCKWNVKKYSRVYESPTQTYTCQKVKTRWVRAGSSDDTSIPPTRG